ncbi:hypothetical protein D9M69_675210 [compost metagenome]
MRQKHHSGIVSARNGSQAAHKCPDGATTVLVGIERIGGVVDNDQPRPLGITFQLTESGCKYR